MSSYNKKTKSSKRGELRYENILLAPKPSSLYKILKYLSSLVLLKMSSLRAGTRGQAIFELVKNKKLPYSNNYKLSYSDTSKLSYSSNSKQSYSDLFRVSIDPRVKPEGDNYYKVMPRFGTNRQGIFELDNNKLSLRGEHLCSTWQSQQNKTISRDVHVSLTGFLSMTKNKIIGKSLIVFWRKRGMTFFKGICNRGMTVLVIFLLSPNLSYSATMFLPDAQNEEVFNALSTPPVVSIDSVRCEEIGYTYYSSGQCPAYHNQETCVFMDKYLKCNAREWCLDNGYTLTSCTTPKILDTQCPNGTTLYKSCVCPSDYTYTCSGTGYSSGVGTVCDGKYTSCNCATNYVWSGSSCVCDSDFKYSCSGTGYSSGSGVACGGKYKSCNCSAAYTWSGSSCSYCGSNYQYSCTSGSNVTGGSGTACGGRYTACTCASDYTWSNGSCVSTCNSSSSNWCPVHSNCHVNCCTDGTIEPCDTRCGGSGCTSGETQDDYYFWCCNSECDYAECYARVGRSCSNHDKYTGCTGTPIFIQCVGPDYPTTDPETGLADDFSHNGARYFCRH